MDTDRFDALVRSLPFALPRRTALGGVLGAGLTALLSLFEAEDAATKKKRRKTKRRKKRCKGGKNRCGKGCCAPEDCVGGSCCPSGRACGAFCCPSGDRCGNPEVARCVAGQGTCETGAHTCAAGELILCNGNSACICAQATDGTTRCATPLADINAPEDCDHCETDADCEVLFPDVVGVFCTANTVGICGCDFGQTLCGAPCPTT